MSILARPANFAGTWYPKRVPELRALLDELYASSHQTDIPGCTNSLSNEMNIRALIGPHAALIYSGRTAANIYKRVNMEGVERIFILGPSHHSYFEGCMLSNFEKYKTVEGDLDVDRELIEKLKSKGHFVELDRSKEVREHSLELHLPFVYDLVQKRKKPCKIVPVMVGVINDSAASKYGKIFSEYMNESSLSVASSDFCHWGPNFDYNYLGDSSQGEIWEKIQNLDFQAMRLIEDINVKGFSEYLSSTGNTICGMHCISILMHTLLNVGKSKPKLKFIAYDQSEKVVSSHSSSVSYASAYATF